MTKQLRIYLYLLSNIISMLLCVVIMLLASVKEPETIGQVIILSDIAEEKSVIDGQQRLLVKGIVKKKIVEEKIIPLNNYQNLIENLDFEEKELLYRVTFAESGNQSIKGQRAVMESVLNRILNENFPNDLKSVITQEGQFSTWPACKEGKYNDEQVLALSLVYSEKPVLPNYNYVYFGTNKQSYGKDYLEIEDHWFGQK